MPAPELPGSEDLTTLLDNIQDAFYALDSGWRFIMLNQHAADFLESTREELLGEICWEKFPEAETLGLKAKYEQAMATGEMVSFGVHYPVHDKWYEIRAVPVSGGVYVYYYSNPDRANEEHLYRALVEKSADGVTLLDANFTPFYRSPANASIFGYNHDETGSLQPLPHQPENLDISEKLRGLAPGESLTREFRRTRADGDSLWINGTFTNRLDDPVLRAYVFNFQDVTERRHLEEVTELNNQELLRSNRELELRIRRLNTLHRVHLATTGSRDFQAVVPDILNEALTDSTAAALVLVESGPELECVASGGLAEPLDAAALQALNEAAAKVIRTRILTVTDLTDEQAGPHGLNGIASLGFQTLQLVPFRAGSTQGALALLTRSEHFDDEEAKSYIAMLTGYIATSFDTARLLDDLRRTASDYQELARFGQRIETITDIDELVSEGLSALLVQLRIDFATLAELTEDWAIPKWRAGDATPEEEEVLLRPIPLAEGAVAEATRTWEPVLICDYQNYSDRPGYLEQMNFTSVLVLPIETGAGGDYVFILASRDADRPLDETAGSIAALFAQRLANAFERVSHVDEVKSTRESTFQLLGLALEHRDFETKGHTDRVAKLTERFGRQIGFSTSQLEELRWGAYLHDLGKLSVPDHVLLKPGRLTDQEFELIKRHPVIGAEICKGIPFLPDSTRHIVRHHHERWDGAGYPDGLSGEDIPLPARVFALVDVYDALTSDRPYRPAWSADKAIRHMQAESGSHFDPELLKQFLELL